MNNREIDRLVEIHFFGREVTTFNQHVEHAMRVPDEEIVLLQDGEEFIYLPKYSERIEDAWEVAEKLSRECQFELTRFENEDKWYCDLTNWSGDNSFIRSVESTASLAICKAALKAVGIEVDDED